ncbi:MAG: glucose-1-phosphate thymidylyltransferase RfbA [Bdellovibrionota bacterium]
MKGILLAGGTGTRLFPSTKAVSKQLLPVYDKPTIYYPLSTLMLAGLSDILIISTPRDIPVIQDLLGDGKQFGIKLSYKVQPSPDGIPQAFLLAEDFLAGSGACLILGDNLFYGHDIPKQMQSAVKRNGATVFAYHVNDPERYGVIEFDKDRKPLSLEEKPKQPKSNWAITGLYFFDQSVVSRSKKLKPSKRNELEITDLIRSYLDESALNIEVMGRGRAWLDTGTHQSLLTASQFVQTIEDRQGLKIACLEEIALLQGFITNDQLKILAESYPNSGYGNYVKQLAAGKLH